MQETLLQDSSTSHTNKNNDDDDNDNDNDDDEENDDDDDDDDDSTYQGHYVIVVGFNAERTKVFFVDPSASPALCCMFADVFDVIRKANGTDEDIIFIKLK